MKMAQKSLCVFIHFGKQAYIPKYVSVYLNELSSFFDQIILVTNHRSLKTDFTRLNQNLLTLFVKNEGYDLGMFYKVFQTIDPTEYNQIACINDSNILFNELISIFTWSKLFKFDFWGLIDSYEKPWFSTHQKNYHIQSHFIVFNQNAISKLPLYFDAINIQDILDEKDIAKLRRTVINEWEIGLSQFLISEGLSSGSYIDSHSYSLQYLHGKQTNVGFKLYPELIKSGFPLLKMKVITKSKWTDIFRSDNHWKNLIRQYGNQNWEIETLIHELSQIRYASDSQNISNIKRKISNVYYSFFAQKFNVGSPTKIKSFPA
jgi:lipopolysaccharide biosynthesis protein